MVRHEQNEMVSIIDREGKKKTFVLPKGVRPCDLTIGPNEDMVLCYLKEKGRLHRNFFVKHGLQDCDTIEKKRIHRSSMCW